jgi:trehalose monomycolate/heme transporter
VSGSFVFADIALIKALGLGTAIAVLLDATVVRALLVPATMRLLGRANWWAPRPMVRWWRSHGFRETEGAHQEPQGSQGWSRSSSQPEVARR